MLIAIFIFIFTRVLVIWQPRGLGIGWSALLGATAALLLGVVQLSDIPVVWNIGMRQRLSLPSSLSA